MLNGRVRNGNGCGHPGKVTGKLLRFPLKTEVVKKKPVYQLVATRVVSVRANYSQKRTDLCFRRGGRGRLADCGEQSRRLARGAEAPGQSKGSMRSSVRLLVPVS
jgi:hypothetical protein